MNELLLTAGIILIGGAICGAIARFLRLPTLTGYITAGILLGPQLLDTLPHEHIEALSGPINDVAMALVLFVLGGQFHAEKLRKSGKKIVTFSCVESLFTFSCVTLLCLPVLPGSFCPRVRHRHQRRPHLRGRKPIDHPRRRVLHRHLPQQDGTPLSRIQRTTRGAVPGRIHIRPRKLQLRPD